MVVFDRRNDDTSALTPIELYPARFETWEQANAGLERWKTWDRKADYSIYQGSINQFIEEQTESSPLIKVNPAWKEANFELRIISLACAQKLGLA